jgi:hypothetical protein
MTPTRIIPAGQTAALPSRGPRPGERPPWWEQSPRPGSPTAPSAPAEAPPPRREAPQPEAAPPPGVLEVRVRYQPDPVQSSPSRWSWRWLTSRLYPWWTLLATVAVLTPFPFTGYSAATTWAYCVGEIRAEHGYGWGYATALGTLGLACLYDARGRHWRIVTRAAGVVTLVGVLGAIHWYDPVQFLTGVTPS